MTRSWANCPVCVREARHEVDGEGMTCLACGAVQRRGGTKEGTEGGIKGGTHSVTIPPRVPPLQSLPPLQRSAPDPSTPAWEVTGEPLRQFDRVAAFAEFVLRRRGPAPRTRCPPGHEGRRGATLAVSVWHDKRGLFVLRVEDGWTAHGREHRERPSAAGDTLDGGVVRGRARRDAVSASRPGVPAMETTGLIECGLLQPTPEEAIPLPDTAPKTQRTYGAILRLVGSGNLTTPFLSSRSSFRAGADGRERRHVQVGPWLARNRFITNVGKGRVRLPEKADLWCWAMSRTCFVSGIRSRSS